jgi:hypothetical protein
MATFFKNHFKYQQVLINLLHSLTLLVNYLAHKCPLFTLAYYNLSLNIHSNVNLGQINKSF